MENIMKKIILSFLALAMIFGAASCSKKSNKAAKGGKTWIVATDTAFRPFEYTNDKNQFVGIDVDLLAAVAEDQGFAYDLQSLGWDGGVAAVQVGQADALIAGATIKQERIDSGWISNQENDCYNFAGNFRGWIPWSFFIRYD